MLEHMMQVMNDLLVNLIDILHAINIASKTGGPRATMRFQTVATHGANNGLVSPRNVLLLCFNTPFYLSGYCPKPVSTHRSKVPQDLYGWFMVTFQTHAENTILWSRSYSIHRSLAGVTAAEYGARGTNFKMSWRAGRVDSPESYTTPDGRLPDAAKGSDHLRAIFHRMVKYISCNIFTHWFLYGYWSCRDYLTKIS